MTPGGGSGCFGRRVGRGCAGAAYTCDQRARHENLSSPALQAVAELQRRFARMPQDDVVPQEFLALAAGRNRAALPDLTHRPIRRAHSACHPLFASGSSAANSAKKSAC